MLKLAISDRLNAAPVATLRRLQTIMISELPQGIDAYCPRITNGLAAAMQSSLPDGGLRLHRQQSNPKRFPSYMSTLLVRDFS